MSWPLLFPTSDILGILERNTGQEKFYSWTSMRRDLPGRVTSNTGRFCRSLFRETRKRCTTLSPQTAMLFSQLRFCRTSWMVVVYPNCRDDVVLSVLLPLQIPASYARCLLWESEVNCGKWILSLLKAVWAWGLAWKAPQSSWRDLLKGEPIIISGITRTSKEFIIPGASLGCVAKHVLKIVPWRCFHLRTMLVLGLLETYKLVIHLKLNFWQLLNTLWVCVFLLIFVIWLAISMFILGKSNFPSQLAFKKMWTTLCISFLLLL